jgi:multisubunit Na+/H+ antiporter MnhG subunit
MPVWMKAAGKWGGILVLIALLITLLKQLIALIGFISVAIKLIIIVVFVLLLVGVGLMVLKGLKQNRKRSE